MGTYNNSIKIDIKFTPKQELQSELKKLLSDISKNTKIDLSNTFDFKSIDSQLKRVKNNLKDSFKLDGFTKSAYSSAKQLEEEFKSLGDTIGKVHEQSNKKNLNDFIKQELLQAKAINKALEEQYNQKIKLNNIKDNLQSKLNISKNNSLVDASVINNLQNKLNSINTNTAEKEIKQLETEIKNLSSSDSQIVRVQNAISNITSKLNNTKLKFGSNVIDKNTITQLENLKKILADLQSGKSFSGAKISSEINNANASIRNLNNSLQESEKNSNGFSRSLRNAFANMGVYVSMQQAIQSVANTIKNASQYVIQLDSALVGLKKVTDETDSTYKQFLETAHNASLELGTQADKFTQATESWAKTGKSLSEATELAKNTMLLTKVGDVQDVDTAQTYLLPALQAFNIEAEKSIDLVDKYNNLSNNMATDVPKMGEAMARGASSLSVAGNSLEETLALIATASQNTQLSGETIGNAMKSISLRIAEFKDEDGEVIPNFENQMKSLGVTMRDQNGQILSTYNILNQVAQKYDEMDKNTQLMVSQLLGGKYQANVVSSILADVDELNRAYQLANNSAGSASKEFETYQQSIQYSVDQLKENINHLYTEMVNSDALKSFVNGLSSAMQWLDNLDGQTLIFIGTVGTLILVLTKLSALNKSLMLGEAVSGLGKFIGLASGMITLENGVTGLTGAFTLLNTGIKGATASAMAFVATPLGMTITAIAVALGVATVAFTSYKKHQEEVQQQTENLKTSIENLNKTLESGSTEGVENDLNTLQKQQDELQNYIKLLEETKEKSESAFNPTASGASKQSVVEGMKQKVAEYKKEIEDAGLHVNNFGEIVELTNAKCKKANLELVESIKQQTAEQLNNRENLQEAQIEYDNYVTSIKNLYNEYMTLSSQENLNAESKARLNAVVQELQGKYSNLSVTIDENGVAYINNIPLIQDSISNLENEGMTIDNLSNIRIADQKINAEWQINNTTVTYQEITKQISWYQAEIKAIQALMMARMNMASITPTGVTKGKEHMSMAEAQAREEADRKANPEQWEQYDNYRHSLVEYQNAKNNIDKLYNSIQVPTYSGGSVPKYSGLGGSSGGGPKGSSGSKQSEAEKWAEKINDLNSDIDIDIYASLNEQLNQLNNRYKDNSEILDNLTEGTREYYNKQKELNEIKKEQMNVYMDLAGTYDTEKKELENKLKQYGILIDETGKLINAEEKLKYQQDLANDMKGNTEAEYNTKKKQIEAVKELEKDIKRYRTVTQTEIPKCTQEWQKLNNEIEKVQKEQLQKLREELVAGLKKEYEKARKDGEDTAKADYEAKKKALEEQYKKDLKDLQDEKQSIIDDYNDEIEELQKQLDALNDDTDDKNAKLASLKAELALWRKELDKENPLAKAKVNELSKSVADLEKEIQKDNLKKKIDALKDNQSQESDMYDDRLDKLKEQYDKDCDNAEQAYKDKQKEIEDLYEDEVKGFLKEHNLYAQADKMITQKQTQEMLKYLQSQDESFKDVGSLLGKNMMDSFNAEIDNGIEAYKSLMGSIGVNTNSVVNSPNGSNNTSSNGNSSSKNNVWIADASTTQVYTSSTGQKSKGSAWSQGIASGNTTSYHTGQYSNGFYEILDNSGNSLGWVDKHKVRNVAKYATGGKTPSDIDNGALAILHSNEKILNAEETSKWEKAVDIINNSLGEFMEKHPNTIEKSLNLIGGYNNPSIDGVNNLDLNKLASNVTNSNTNNSNVNEINMINNIYNTNAKETAINEKSMERIVTKCINNQIGMYGGKVFTTRK